MRTAAAAVPEEDFVNCILKMVKLYRYTGKGAEEDQIYRRKSSHHIKNM
jgi:hypothetical protein